jgi:anti-anti-sigma regulatory factor
MLSITFVEKIFQEFVPFINLIFQMEITKNEKYVIYTPKSANLDENIGAQMEKSIAVLYATTGMINFILDLKNVTSISDAGIKLLQKVQKITKDESGLWVLVSLDDNLMEDIANRSEEFILILPSVEEAIDAVFMNELENDFKDEQEDDFGFEAESDY